MKFKRYWCAEDSPPVKVKFCLNVAGMIFLYRLLRYYAKATMILAIFCFFLTRCEATILLTPQQEFTIACEAGDVAKVTDLLKDPGVTPTISHFFAVDRQNAASDQPNSYNKILTLLVRDKRALKNPFNSSASKYSDQVVRFFFIVHVLTGCFWIFRKKSNPLISHYRLPQRGVRAAIRLQALLTS